MSQFTNTDYKKISECHDLYIELTEEVFGITKEDAETSALSLYLYNIRDLPYDPKTVRAALEEAAKSIDNFESYEIAQYFSKYYPLLSKQISNEIEAETIISEQKDDIFYQFSTFCTHPLPQTKTDNTEQITEYPNNKLIVTSSKGLPYGGIARMIILYINSMAVKYRSREISLGKSIRAFVTKLGYSPSYTPDGTNQQVIDQLEKLFHTTYINSKINKIKQANDEYIIEKEDARFHLFDGKITWEHIKSNLVENSSATVILSERYFNEILKHPVPLSLDSLKQLKKSPLAIDLYCLLAYRVNTGENVVIPYSALKKQFAIEGSMRDFKMSLKRANEYLVKVWPECNIHFKPQVMFIPRAKPPVSNKK